MVYPACVQACVPVVTEGVDRAVDSGSQLFAIWATSILAAVVVGLVVRLCLRERITWPLFLLVGGTITALQEPLFDHLYGLWFYTEGQDTAFHTYGIQVPVWLPIIYVSYYGGLTIFFTRLFSRGVTQRKIVQYFLLSVLLAATAEIFYINLCHLYGYQHDQAFVVWHYPVWVAFVNGVPPFLAAIALARLVPLARGWAQVGLLFVVPTAFAADSFGTGFLYLSVRHAAWEHGTPMALVHVAAALTACLTFSLVLTCAKLAGLATPRPLDPPRMAARVNQIAPAGIDR